MASILYQRIDGKIVEERVQATDVAFLLSRGYASTPEALELKESVDTNNSGLLSDAEIKDAAREAGIKIGRKSIKTLKDELGLE